MDWCQFDPEQQALQIGRTRALTGLLARRLSSVTVLDASEENLEVVRRRFQTEPELAANIRHVCADVETYAMKAESVADIWICNADRGLTAADKAGRAAQMTAAKQLLLLMEPDAAASNWFGVKHSRRRAGDGRTFWNEMKQLLPGGEFYYPMPDYRTARDFSDAYLPKKAI